MSKSLSLCVALLLALLFVPAAMADEAPVSPAAATDGQFCSAAVQSAGVPAATEAPPALAGSADGQVFLGGACEACAATCGATRSACISGCGTNYPCIRQCNCDFYWCMDACPCGEQDPPPAGC